MPFSISHVIDQHAEETAILWARRTRLAGEPHVSLDALARVDAQLVAHLEGLRLAGEAGRQACWREFNDWPQPAEAFAVAALALETGVEADWQQAIDAAVADANLARSLASALAWRPLEAVSALIDELLDDSRPVSQEIGARAAGIHRHEAHGRLWSLLRIDAPPAAAIRACRAAAEMGRTELAGRLVELAASANGDLQVAAAGAAASLGDEPALETLLTLYQPVVGRRDHALRVLAGRLPVDRAGAWLRRLFDSGGSHHRRAALLAAGIVGDPAQLPWLIERLNDAKLARLAGDAIGAMCGIHLGIERLERPWPEGIESGPNDDPADDDVSLDLDENRLWPDADRVAAWWQANGARFPAGVRHLTGRPPDEAWLKHVQRHGMQPQRAIAAQELAWRSPGAPTFDVRARGWRQLAELGL